MRSLESSETPVLYTGRNSNNYMDLIIEVDISSVRYKTNIIRL